MKAGVFFWEQMGREVEEARRGVLESSEELLADCSRRGMSLWSEIRTKNGGGGWISQYGVVCDPNKGSLWGQSG